MFGFSTIDIVVIVVYFLVLVYIGFRSMKTIHNQEDFFLAGRRFGKLVQTFAAFGQATSSDTAVSVTTTTVTNGAGGIWSALNLLFATPVYWMTSVWYRRMRVLSIGDFFEERFQSKSLAGAYAAVQAVYLMMLLSLGFNAMSKTVMALTPKTVEQFSVVEMAEYERSLELDKLEAVDYMSLSAAEKERLEQLHLEKPRNVFSHTSKEMLIWVVSIIVLIYSAAGGLHAAFVTDTVQGMFILLLSIILLPFAFTRINSLYGGSGALGAFRIMHEKLPESFFEVMGSPSNIDFTWYYILTISIMLTFTVMVDPNQLSTTGSARNEYTARLGCTTGCYLKRFCTVMWGVLGLAAIVLYGKSVRDPDLMWGHATRDLVGPLNLGLVGLVAVCFMAALMSSADCFMVTSSNLLTRNLYRVLVPSRTEEHYINIGRFLGAATIIGGAVITLGFESILQQMKFLWDFSIIFAAPFWLGILWRCATRKAAWFSVIAALVLFFIFPGILPFFAKGLRTNSYLLKMTDPRVVERQYTAHEMDVQERNEEIAKWDRLEADIKKLMPKPEPIEVGQRCTKHYLQPRKSIFWRDGVKMNEQGLLQGYGMLNPDLLLYDKLGFDLAKNPYALNETLRILTRMLMPIFIMVLVSYLTRPNDRRLLDMFYVKMKTPVLEDRQADQRELEISYSNPHRFDHLKMFPGTDWEFCRWNKVDIVGFTASMLIAFAIVGLLYLIVSIGG